jgi:hypothetical protein
MPPMPQFDGRIGALDRWLTAMEQQFVFNAIAADADRIRYAAALWTGAALDWWVQTGAAHPATWDELVFDLRARFMPIDSAKSVRTQLLALQQGKGSAAVYVGAFTRLVGGVAATMSPEDQLFQFLRGLNPELAKLVAMSDAKTLIDAQTVAVRVGTTMSASSSSSSSGGGNEMDVNNIEGLEKETADDETGSDAPVTQKQMQQQLHQMLAAIQSQHRGGGSSNPSRSKDAYVPRGLPVIKGMTPQQVKAYMDAGKCFGCGSTDHLGRNCPKRIVDADGKASWGK